MLIDLIMGGPGREAAVSRRSGACLAAALRRRGHDVLEIDLSGRLEPERLRPGAVVFNTVHGTYGEDGGLQSELDRLGRSYVGSSAEASRLCMDKAATKRCLSAAGLRVPHGIDIVLGTRCPTDSIPDGPLVLKPRDDGSSVGLRLLEDRGQLAEALAGLRSELGPRPYLIEERLPGPEFTVAVLEGADGPTALPPLAIRPAQGVFDYQAKYHRDDTREEPVEDRALARSLAMLAVAAHRACGCRDLSRTDLMLAADGEPVLLEVNTLPGMTTASLTPKAAAAAGIPFDELADRLVHRAAARMTGGSP